MKVITENCTAEIVEKKSRFIANIFYVDNEIKVEEKLEYTRKKFYGARHNCYAYILGESGNVVKSSDDGEPQGTAGHPILDILKSEELTNCIVIVTRYFGGTLLGTGGLVRAYSDVAKEALKNASLSYLYEGYIVNFDIDYDEYGKIENITSGINGKYANNNPNISSDCNENNIRQSIGKVSFDNLPIKSISKNFEGAIKLVYLVRDNVFDEFKAQISNITRGKISLEKNEKKLYYISGKEIVYL